MSINIDQLPIPDWGLHCRGCGYLLSHLPEHRCPECGRQIVMSELINSWTRLRDPTYRGSELPVPDFGLHCSACAAPLAGARQPACGQCGAPAGLAGHLPKEEWYAVPPTLFGDMSAVDIGLLLDEAMIPYQRRDRRDLSRIYGLDATVDVRFVIAGEFYFDLLAAVRQRALEVRDAQGSEWTCTRCGEANPPTFRICWNCSTTEPIADM